MQTNAVLNLAWFRAVLDRFRAVLDWFGLSPGGATGDVTGGATGGANHGHGREYGAEVDHYQLPARTYWFETILGSIQAARLAANTTMGKHS